MAMTGGVTALGTRLFGRYGEGKGLDKHGLNQVKKDADAISAYAMSESLWYLSRHLPENHAIMVCLGEGLMPKAGETPEMGSQPAARLRPHLRPARRWRAGSTARWCGCSTTPEYGWDEFYRDIEDGRHHHLGRGHRHPGEHLAASPRAADRAADRAAPVRPAAVA